LKARRPFSRRPRPVPSGTLADFPVFHPPRVGQSPGGSLARPSRPHLRPGPGEPVRWARPPCGGAPPLGPFRHRLHRPRWGVSLRLTPSVAPASWLEPPPQATGTYWPGLLGRRAHLARDGRGCGALVATHPPLRPGAAGWASGIPAGSPLPRGSFWPSPFLRGSTPRRFRYSPSGEAFFPLSGKGPRPGPPPKGAEAPWAGNPG